MTTRDVLWRRLDRVGLERCRLVAGPDGVRLAGTVLLAGDDGPLHVEYVVECTAAWETRAAHVAVVLPRGERRLALERDAGGRWWAAGDDGARHERPDLAGCVDVDVSVTPSTNVLPIRRLALAVGEARDVTAAWVRLPALVVEPLPQRYARTGERRWRYESGGGAFVADLDVDDDGLVRRYPPGWERVGP